MKNDSKFTITYTGLIYPGKQRPELLITSLRNLIEENKIDYNDCEIRMYGGYASGHDCPITKHYGKIPVKWYGKVPHNEAVQAQKESQLLWLLDLDDPNELGAIPGKIFEYLGARRPILATGGVKGNVVDGLLKETGAGYHAVSVEETEQVLLKYYREWKETGRVDYHGVGVERYTFKEMARKYVELLH